MVIIRAEFIVKCLGLTVGGYGSSFEVSLDDLSFKTNKEKEEYVEKCIKKYILESIEFEYEIK